MKFNACQGIRFSSSAVQKWQGDQFFSFWACVNIAHAVVHFHTCHPEVLQGLRYFPCGRNGPTPITQGPLGAADGTWRIDRINLKEKIIDFAAADFVGNAAWDLGLLGDWTLCLGSPTARSIYIYIYY